MFKNLILVLILILGASVASANPAHWLSRNNGNLLPGLCVNNTLDINTSFNSANSHYPHINSYVGSLNSYNPATDLFSNGAPRAIAISEMGLVRKFQNSGRFIPPACKVSIHSLECNDSVFNMPVGTPEVSGLLVAENTGERVLDAIAFTNASTNQGFIKTSHVIVADRAMTIYGYYNRSLHAEIVDRLEIPSLCQEELPQNQRTAGVMSGFKTGVDSFVGLTSNNGFYPNQISRVGLSESQFKLIAANNGADIVLTKVSRDARIGMNKFEGVINSGVHRGLRMTAEVKSFYRACDSHNAEHVLAKIYILNTSGQNVFEGLFSLRGRAEFNSRFKSPAQNCSRRQVLDGNNNVIN